MQKFFADLIYPISSPSIKNGMVITDDAGKITEILSPEQDEYSGAIEGAQKLSGFICPGFVNTHCHLELSYLKNKISEKRGLNEFIVELQKTRNHFDQDTIDAAIVEAEIEMLKNGIVAVADICNGSTTIKPKEKENLYYHSFIELFGFDEQRAESIFKSGEELFSFFKSKGLAVSITPHAPYSTSKKLMEMIAAHNQQHASLVSIHNQETEEENKLFTNKSGKMAGMLERFNIDLSAWHCPGINSLPAYYNTIKSKSNTLLVHNTFTTKKDMLEVNDNSTFWCLCPDANLYIENRLPNIQALIDINAVITIGTDSLASNHGLSVLQELLTIKKHNPALSTSTLLSWGTLNGARYLGIQSKFGSLEKGKIPGLVLVSDFDTEIATVKRLI